MAPPPPTTRVAVGVWLQKKKNEKDTHTHTGCSCLAFESKRRLCLGMAFARVTLAQSLLVLGVDQGIV